MAGEKPGKFRFPGSALSLDGMVAGGTKIAAMPRGLSGFDSAAHARAAGRRLVPSIPGKQLGGGPPSGKRNEGHFDLIRLFEARFLYDVGRTLQ